MSRLHVLPAGRTAPLKGGSSLGPTQCPGRLPSGRLRHLVSSLWRALQKPNSTLVWLTGGVVETTPKYRDNPDCCSPNVIRRAQAALGYTNPGYGSANVAETPDLWTRSDGLSDRKALPLGLQRINASIPGVFPETQHNLNTKNNL